MYPICTTTTTSPIPRRPPQADPPPLSSLFSIVPLPPHHRTTPSNASPLVWPTIRHTKTPALPTVHDRAMTSSHVPYTSSSEEEDDDDEYHRIIQVDPTGRFQCWDICLGKGAFKEVYKAFDVEEGIEVAWNQLRTEIISRKDISKVASEVKLLKQLRHDNIINFTDVWTDRGTDGRERVYFITELMSSGTLKSFIKKTKGKLKPKVVKNLCRHILNGLVYLHSRRPPIIHRDLKCDNIFINGNNGIAKIGDLGLATIKNRDHISSVLGTPEFMAPELYDEKYDERVDIYAFGMCVLELVTKEYPYQECSNQAQIWKRVSAGIKPHALTKISDLDTREFIELCITHDYHLRPSADQLLRHPFLVTERPGTPALVSSLPPTPTVKNNPFAFSLSPSLSPPTITSSNSALKAISTHDHHQQNQQHRTVSSGHRVHFDQLAPLSAALPKSSPSPPSPPSPILLSRSRKPSSQSSIHSNESSRNAYHNHHSVSKPTRDRLSPPTPLPPKIMTEQLQPDPNAPATPEGIFRTMPPIGSNRAPFQLTMQVTDLNLAQFTLTVKMAMWTGPSPTESELLGPGISENGTKHEVRFPFHLVHDTVQDIVDEMLREGVVELTDMERSDVANMMRAVVYGDEVSELVLAQADQVARDQLARMDALDWQSEHREHPPAQHGDSQFMTSAAVVDKLPLAEEIMDPKMFGAWVETMQQERRILDLYEVAHGASDNSSPLSQDNALLSADDEPPAEEDSDSISSGGDNSAGPSWAVHYVQQDDMASSFHSTSSAHASSASVHAEDVCTSLPNDPAGDSSSCNVIPPPSPPAAFTRSFNSTEHSEPSESSPRESVPQPSNDDSELPQPMNDSGTVPTHPASPLRLPLEPSNSAGGSIMGSSTLALSMPACPGDGAYISQFRRPQGSSSLSTPASAKAILSPIKIVSSAFSSPSTSLTPTPTSAALPVKSPAVRNGQPPVPSTPFVSGSVEPDSVHETSTELKASPPGTPPSDPAHAALMSPLIPVAAVAPIIATEPALLRTLSELQSLALSGFAEDTMGRSHSSLPLTVLGGHILPPGTSSVTTSLSMPRSAPHPFAPSVASGASVHMNPMPAGDVFGIDMGGGVPTNPPVGQRSAPVSCKNSSLGRSKSS